MSETLNVELTEQQQELILKGLRFIHRSVLLDIREPSPEVEEDRRVQLQEITSLVDQLNGSHPANATTGV